MADSSHLEKMGRELKCPICLSLFSSAVSLTCNHIFCNLCLTKSMKADSHCPVCKVPYRRREIRPAPHMDNLVSIYRTMEVASGVNIHVTQNAPSTKAPDDEDQLVDGKSTPVISDVGENSRGKPKTQRKFKKKGSKVSTKTVKEALGSQLPVKPSFPAKKRVHVPQCLESETPTRIAKSGERLGKQVATGSWDGSNVLKEKPSSTARGEPLFTPFFWLREREEGDKDDMERLSSQTMEIDQLTSTPQIFSFSDIKDSEDENRMDENEKLGDQSKHSDLFDSEMFEWTQRPCSPELGSTPVKNKVTYQKKHARAQENNEGSETFTTTAEELVPENTIKGNGSAAIESLSSGKDESIKAPIGRTKFNKVGKSKRKQDDSSVVAAHSDVEGLCQGSARFTNDIVSNTGNKTSTKKRKNTSNGKVLKKATEEVPLFNEVKIKNLSDHNTRTSTGVSRNVFENVKDSCKTIKTRKSQRSQYKSQNENVVPSVAKQPKESLVVQEERNGSGKIQNCLQSFQENGVSTGLDNEISLESMENENEGQRKPVGNLIERKRLKTSKDVTSKSVLVGKVLKGCNKVATKKVQTSTGSESTPKDKASDSLQPTGTVLTVTKDMSLRKCDSITTQSCCAFCQSTNDSAVSGEMMHYLNGKPVAPDYNGGSSIIHAHKKCTEWAPNVYFEDLIAINLETEVARSRRIKCSCCGIKGAALGCFEKSCRRSFHVPCAKLMSQCRWDNENFVILCPLHSTSKLPKELPASQVKKQKSHISKRESHTNQADVVVHHGVSRTCSWKGSSNKLVLCCSGLTAAEKEIVSEFTKFAGVSLSKTYQPNVTHIIASTDENGACRRTLKFLLGILDGKWILKLDWLKACMKATEPVSEEKYEISVDIHGIKDGPKLGRLRISNKQPKLFNGCSFYFMGEFLPSYKGYLQDLVLAAGGTVLQRKPVSGDACGLSYASTFIVYNAEPPEEHQSAKKSLQSCIREEAEVLATLTGAKVAGHFWLLDSIAGCTLQSC